MSISEAEKSFVHTFLKPELRDRWLEMLGSPKKRYKQLARLYHHLDFTAQETRALPRRASDDYSTLPALLLREGAGGPVFAISVKREIDNQVFSFSQAMDSNEGCGWSVATVCVYIPDRLAVWTDEYGHQHLLRNPGSS